MVKINLATYNPNSDTKEQIVQIFRTLETYSRALIEIQGMLRKHDEGFADHEDVIQELKKIFV